MNKEVSNQYYLESAPMKKAIFHLSVPMMIGMSVGTVYNVINAYFIGLLHNTGMLTAITLGLPIFTVLMAFGNVFGVGAEPSSPGWPGRRIRRRESGSPDIPSMQASSPGSLSPCWRCWRLIRSPACSVRMRQPSLTRRPMP